MKKRAVAVDEYGFPIEFGGLRRVGYLIFDLVIHLFVLGVAVALSAPANSGEAQFFDLDKDSTFLLIAILTFLLLLPVAFRLQNIGLSKWFTVLWVVPVFAPALLYPILVGLPEGWAKSRQMDKVAWAIILCAPLIWLVRILLLLAIQMPKNW